MPTDNAYSLQDLADLANVSPRTIRYYVAQGLLPSPGQVGPGAHYTDAHLARLRLIRRLQRDHLPLAEIRAKLAALDDETIASLVEGEAAAPPPSSSALDYVRSVLGGGVTATRSRGAPDGQALRRLDLFEVQPANSPSLPAPPTPAKPAPSEPPPDRSQWDRISLTPDIELHIRRPLSRLQNKRVERLIAIARELLEENPS
ncbi:MAG: MerR family transcriptional regulator [Chloroflexota bacterium]